MPDSLPFAIFDDEIAEPQEEADAGATYELKSPPRMRTGLLSIFEDPRASPTAPSLLGMENNSVPESPPHQTDAFQIFQDQSESPVVYHEGTPSPGVTANPRQEAVWNASPEVSMCA